MRSNRRDLESFLRANTTYDVDLIFETKSLTQIYAMCKSIEEKMKKYPLEIIEHIENNPSSTINISYAEVYQLNYNDLIALRKSLGIKNTRKKVKNSTQAAPESYQLGLDYIQQTSTRDLCRSIISSEEKEHDLQILTRDEIREMYGDEEPSREFLASRGIVLDSPKEDESIIDPEIERYELMASLIDANISISGIPLNEQYLYYLNEEELKQIQNFVKKFKDSLNNDQKRKLK